MLERWLVVKPCFILNHHKCNLLHPAIYLTSIASFFEISILKIKIMSTHLTYPLRIAPIQEARQLSKMVILIRDMICFVIRNKDWSGVKKIVKRDLAMILNLPIFLKK